MEVIEEKSENECRFQLFQRRKLNRKNKRQKSTELGYTVLKRSDKTLT